MKETPISFSKEFVLSILNDNKNQTRRFIKQQPKNIYLDVMENYGTCEERHTGEWSFYDCSRGWLYDPILVKSICCPYGKVGDILWVREEWIHYQPITYSVRQSGASFTEVQDGCAAYKADGWETVQDFREECLAENSDWEQVEIYDERFISASKMPRWASRIELEIVNIRVERLHDITIYDAKAEGTPETFGEAQRIFTIEELGDRVANFWDDHTSIENFAWMWDRIMDKAGCRWVDNPFVWVVDFKKQKTLHYQEKK